MTPLIYGTIPKDLELEKPYWMKLNQEDLTLVGAAINQGIDSHLEGVSHTELMRTSTHIELTIDCSRSMRCLLRRLMETEEQDAELLAEDIITSLGYEWT